MRDLTIEDKSVSYCAVRWFSQELQQSLQRKDWLQLNKAIRTRFSYPVGDRRPLVFHGRMQWVYCSLLGRLLASLIRPLSILPDDCTRHTEFTFKIGLRAGELLKQRTYHRIERGDFLFTSIFSSQPFLHEIFSGGIGMRLKLQAKRGALLFRDQGYFIRLWRWTFPLPRMLSLGYFDLLHRNLDDQRFQVILRVVHPLFGTLFYQRGEFCAVQEDDNV